MTYTQNRLFYGIKQQNKSTITHHGIIIRRSGKYHYVYKVLDTFRNEAGQPTNTRKSIGKLDADGKMLIPNDAYREFYADTSVASDLVVSTITPSFDSVRSIGVIFLVEQT